MIVISKDNPWPVLSRVANDFHFPIFAAEKISEMGSNVSVAIHHLPLDQVISDLALLRDELETLIPVALH